MTLKATDYLVAPSANEIEKAKRTDMIIQFLRDRDDQLMVNDGPARDTHEGCELALRKVYLIATTGSDKEPKKEG